MELSNELVSQFVKVTKDDKKENNGATVNGTVVKYNGLDYVKLDGSDVLTPVSTTTAVKDKDRVIVTIKNHSATVTGNLSSPSASDKDVKDIGNKISEFEIIIADKVVADDIEAINGYFEKIKAQIANFTDMEAVTAEIETLQSKYANLTHVTANDVEALNAEIENLRATFGKFTDISTEDLTAINAELDNLKAYNATFTYVSAEVLEAIKANVQDLEVKKLSAKAADLKYANIDFSNIGEAAMEYFYANSGLIKDVIVDNGTITGNLIGVTISGDLIEGNTIVAEKLVIKGDDGLYYKLNTDGVTTESEQTDYNSLNGNVIRAKSVTAEKINVSDLVAFDATIGGFNLTEGSIYSGVKNSVDNTTRGIFLGKDGQVAFGDANNFLKYYKDESGAYRLEISAGSIKMGNSKKTVEDELAEIRDEVTMNLRIESSRGTVFKNNSVSTVLSAVVYRGSKRITDVETLKQECGNSTYLQWSWQRLDDERFGIILSTDSRLSNGGFSFTLSPDDVDTKVTFLCQLITD